MKRRLLLVILLALIPLPACAQLTAVSPDENNEIVVVMTDYGFQPSTIRVEAGQQITIILRNEGQKLHEFMVGHDPHVEGNFTEPFAEDFFEGLEISVEGGMAMGLPGMDMDMDEDHQEDSGMDMDMDTGDDHQDDGGMDMDEDHQEDSGMDMDMDTGDDHQDGGHDEALAGEYGAVQLPEMDDHGGIMVMIYPTEVLANQEARIILTITEDKIGTWEFGCFQERGQHYDDGMSGTLIVEAGS